MSNFKEKFNNAWSDFGFWITGGNGKFTLGHGFLLGLMIMAPILLIILTPWFFSFVFPEVGDELTIATIVLGCLFALSFIVLIFVQSASNMDIFKMTREDWRDLFKFGKNRPK